MSELLNLGYDVEKVYEKHDNLREQVKKIRDWIKAQNGSSVIPTNLTDSQIAPFILACLRNEDDTKKCMTEYYNLRKSAPEFFTGRDTSRREIIEQQNVLETVIMPKDTPNGYRILVHRLCDYNASNYIMDHAMKVFFMSLDLALHREPAKGLLILFDMQGVRLAHLTKCRLGAVKKFTHYLQEALPTRLVAIHVLNITNFMDKVMAFVKPFLKSEVIQMLHLHLPNINMEEFYTNCIPKECLPSDFGGTNPSLAELYAMQRKELEALVPYFTAEQKQRGAVEKIDDFEIKSSFTKLEID